jgi:hypothetical protein
MPRHVRFLPLSLFTRTPASICHSSLARDLAPPPARTLSLSLSRVWPLPPHVFSQGTMRLKGSQAEVTMAQAGREVPLGLLPFLPIHAPTETLEVAPEFVTIFGPTGISTAHRIASISFAPPAMMRLVALDGSVVVLHSASHGEVWLANGTFSHGFCSACSTVQLKSFINASEGLVAAQVRREEPAHAHARARISGARQRVAGSLPLPPRRPLYLSSSHGRLMFFLLCLQAAFNAEIEVMSEHEEALCGDAANVGQVLHMSSMTIERAEALPEICSIAPVSDEEYEQGEEGEDEDPARRELSHGKASIDKGNGVSKMSKKAKKKYKYTLLKSVGGYYGAKQIAGKYGVSWTFEFAEWDTDMDGELTLAEMLSYAPIAFSFNEVCDPEDAEEFAYLFTCCFFHNIAEMQYPYDTVNLVEFLTYAAQLESPKKEYKEWKKETMDDMSRRQFKKKMKAFKKGTLIDADAIDCEVDDAAIAAVEAEARRELGDVRGRELSHSPLCPPPSSGCHPATSTLKLESGKAIRIDDVQVGDRIATPEGFEPVVGRLHADKTNSMEYYRFTTAAGTSMAVSKRHHIFANGVRTAPEKVVVGDMLTTESGAEEVATITKAYEAGVYTIITPSGTYYVDGVASTTYVAYIPYTVWRIFADGYVHLRYLLGAPIVASGEGLLPLFAQYELLEMLNLPEPLMFMLWPLTLLTTVAAELVNKVVASTPAMLTTCATATMAYKLVHGSHK